MAKLGLIVLLFTLLIALVSTARPTSNRQLEKTLMAKYERRHRPVKRESTTTTVKAFIVINHIEEVNQDEQTMIVHGMLWAQWKDEYLTWDPKNWSNVDMITIQPWKIWQPAFALYNSAKTNSWYLYMNGQPATVTSTGKVSAIGAFTFHVTCSFDFTAFPYDVQVR
uniref:Neur_chan_LBD domain-containing protein n=1 Tax=Bursaphelenchus xylophilus TaxID=6326 RepID=A0A1I7SJV1_BURXY